MNEPTQFGPLNEALSRRYGTSDLAGPVYTFASDAFPVIDVSDDGMAPEMHYLAGSRLCSARVATGPPAGQIGAGGIRNPLGSGVIIVVERVVATITTAGSITGWLERGLTLTPSSTVSTVARDTRFEASAPRCFIDARVGGMGIAPAVLMGELRTPAGQPQVIPWLPVILKPGTQVFVQNDTALDTSFFNWIWRERRVTGVELA